MPSYCGPVFLYWICNVNSFCDEPYLPPTTEEVNAIARDVCLSVLSVCKITQKRVHGFGWHFACWQVSGHGRTDQLLSPIRIIVRMHSPIAYAPQHRILLRWESPTYMYWPPIVAARRGFKMVLFTASCRNTFVRGTCALPSALLVLVLCCSLTLIKIQSTVQVWTLFTLLVLLAV